MSPRRGASGLSGILLVDKPAGCTSHDVINRVRRATGEKRVGHAGTLDPLATGLLVVLVGPATRLAPYLTADHKSYVASIDLGKATDTDDLEGLSVREAPVPLTLLDDTVAQAVLDGLLGDSMQRPPAYSAIKVGGKVAHRVARAGQEIELAQRPITVLKAQLLSIDADAARWTVSFVVSKGTYIRSLARDIGERNGTAAHLAALRRTASGPLLVEDAHDLDAIASAGEHGEIASLFADPRRAFPGLPTVTAAEAHVLTGKPLQVETSERIEPLYAVYVEGGRLGALYRPDVSGGRLVPEVVLATPVSGRL